MSGAEAAVVPEGTLGVGDSPATAGTAVTDAGEAPTGGVKATSVKTDAPAPATDAPTTVPSSGSVGTGAGAGAGAGGSGAGGAASAVAAASDGSTGKGEGDVIGGVRLEDGTEEVDDAALGRFSKWLAEHGAKYPKIKWPSYDTVGGVRGTTAIEKIESGEPMLCIPSKLMISPPVAKESEIGFVFLENPEIFGKYESDRIIAVFVCYERLKGEKSFWAPFLDILPHPGSVADWNDLEMDELQNESVSRRLPRILLRYEQTATVICGKYPDVFPPDKFTPELFEWAWMTVQARAFGRFLPYTALVPFADCLNHSNVQTKYDFNVDKNDMFRLMPVGRNCYEVGDEVFNSYGKRNNRHLLLNYGFAIEDNMHEVVAVQASLSRYDPLYDQKHAVMLRFLFGSSKAYQVQFNMFQPEVVSYYRLATLTEEELGDESEIVRFYTGPINFASEIRALKAARALYQRYIDEFKTTLAADEALQAAGGLSSRMAVALAYRITRKRIYYQQIDYIDAMIPLVECMDKQVELHPDQAEKNTLPNYVRTLLFRSADLTL